ncbi:MAG: hypothetical protein JNL54_02610 [Kineosporiaceae bacterium]|nr:hypothetical protein [Kineosporiaceae bacterium]
MPDTVPAPSPQGSAEPGAGPRPWQVQVMLPVHTGTPRAARRLVTTLLIAWGLLDQVERAELIASELTSHVVAHRLPGEESAADLAAAGTLELQVTGDAEELCLMVITSVRLGDDAEPATLPGNPTFSLIDHLADDWGLDQGGFGTRLWAMIALGST